MTTTDKSKMSRQDRLRKVLAGTEKHFPPNASLTLAGATYTPAQLADLAKKDIAASDKATQTKAAWLTTVQVQRDMHAQVDPVFRAFRSVVIVQFGESQNAADVLADFCYTPAKPRNKNIAVKDAAAKKAKATRAARHTMGKRQKAKVRGTFPETAAAGATPTGSAPPTTTPSAVTPTAPTAA